jgi:multisubunit Na+/H+ antiporter MnhG subunit
MLKEELKHIDNSDEAVKKTGITVGVVLILISLLLWYLGKTSFVYFSIAGGLFVILAFITIPVLRPFHKLWMMLALAMGFVMSRVILTILYYLILTPIGLIAKLVGKKFMPLGFNRSASTYWEKRENPVKQQIDYERQF